MSRARPLGRRTRLRASGGLLAALALTVGACTGDPAPAPATAPSPTGSHGPLLAETDLGGGTTEVVTDPAFLAALDRLGVAQRATGGGERAGTGTAGGPGTSSFPVTGGVLAVGAGGALGGEVRHEGSGLLLTDGSSSVSLDDLVLDGDEGVVTATVSVDGDVHAEDAPVLAVTAAGVEVTAAGADGPASGEPRAPLVVRGLRLALTAQGAEVLNEVLAPEGFAPGLPVGDVTLTLEPERP